jgi:hypothetical protein
MKKFGFRLLIFFGIPLLFFGLLEIFIFEFKEELLSEQNLESIYKQDAGNYAWVNNVNADSLKILSGSSSVRYGLSCTILNYLSSNKYNYVNIAMDARDPIQTYFILKNLDLKNVSAIYFGLDPWIYTKRYYMHRNKYLYLDFSFMQILKFSKEHDKSAFLKRYKSLIASILPHNFNVSTNKNQKIPDDYGSIVLDSKAINFNDSAYNWFQIDKYGWSELQFIYLNKIAKLCNIKKVEFAVFIPPKRSDYSKDYKENCSLIHNEFLNNLVDENFNSQIFGKFDQLDSLGDFDNFKEAYHLNKNGQNKYSKLFYELAKNRKSVFSKDYLWFNN